MATKRKTKFNIIRKLLSILVVLGFLFSTFLIYIKVNPIEISWVIEELTKRDLIDKNTSIKKLYLGYNKSVVIIANDVKVKNEFANVSIKTAFIRIAKASLLYLRPVIREIETQNVDIYIDANKFKQSQKTDTNKVFSIKDATSSKLIQNVKIIKVTDANVTINIEDGLKKLEDINISLFKNEKVLNLVATGSLQIEQNITPINIKIQMPDSSDLITFEVDIDDVHIKEIMKILVPNSPVMVTSKGSIKAYGEFTSDKDLKDLHGTITLGKGFVTAEGTYNKNLDFKNLSTEFQLNLKENKLFFNKGKLTNHVNAVLNTDGYILLDENNPELHISVKTDEMSVKDTFKYIPDFEFKNWLNKNITAGTFKDINFEYHGGFSDVPLDGEDDHPYFDIKANFKGLSSKYYENLSPITEGKGQFSMLKKSIDINIDSAKLSDQVIKRGSVNIAPLFNENKNELPKITIKTLSNGSLEGIIKELDKQISVTKKFPEIQNYKGIQETQSTIIINLTDLAENSSKNNVKKAFDIDIVSDLNSINGIDPILKQKFQTSDGKLKIKNNKLVLNTKGFINDKPFSLALKDYDIYNFGATTNINVKAKVDNFTLKELADIQGINFSGISSVDVNLKKDKENWGFDLLLDLKQSLIKNDILHYTKPLNKEGILVAQGVINKASNKFDINSFGVNIADFKTSGYAKLNLNDPLKSDIKIDNLIVSNKTNVKQMRLKNRTLEILGEKLSMDLGPLINNLTPKSSTNDSKKETRKSVEKASLKYINIKLDEAILSKGATPLYDLNVDLKLNGAYKGIIKAKHSKGSQDFYIRFKQKDKNTTTIDSLIPDFGRALRNVTGYKNLRNGFGLIAGDLVFNKGHFNTADLTVKVKDFQIVKAPALAKVLAVVSLEQLLSSKKGILFDRLFAKINIKDSVVKIRKGSMKGPSIGILLDGEMNLKTDSVYFKGTLIPLAELNTLLSKIPLIGYLLTGSQKAISGTDFKIKGTIQKPKVKVYPLSILTPGILKDIF
ncbi:MAG: DUF3971 domain-containing protein [Proteobacteria bacterium]|nr:DUF3971 domain-containing protein [Pseudomonadota bacterium]